MGGRVMTNELKDRVDKIAHLEEFFPFEMVQGDCGKRNNPETNICLNTGASWMVSQDGKSAHKVRNALEDINDIPQLIKDLFYFYQSFKKSWSKAEDDWAREKIQKEDLQKLIKDQQARIEELEGENSTLVALLNKQLFRNDDLKAREKVLVEALNNLPLRVKGYVVSNASDIPALFVLGKKHAETVADLVKQVSKRPDWVSIREASIIKTYAHDGWCQDITMPDTKELIKEALQSTKETSHE